MKLTLDDTPVPAVEGQEYVFDHGEDFGGEVTYTVGPKCDQNHGQWICTTHTEAFINQFEKDSHLIEQRKKGNVCTLAWLCYEHGSEVP